jgi:hypothetical protein
MIYLRERRGMTIVTGNLKLALYVLEGHKVKGHQIPFGFGHEFKRERRFIAYGTPLPPEMHRR